MIITIFTPTYNRGYILSNLYESLKRQTCKKFEWVVVDDGSTDNTVDLFKEWLQMTDFPVRYFRQENSGKHIAINQGVQKAQGELFFIVDSDDYLTNDAVECVLNEWQMVTNKEKYVGLCFRRQYIKSGKIVGEAFPKERFDATHLELRYKYRISGDNNDIFVTSILKSFPYPKIEGEIFVPEALVTYRIASKGLKLRCVEKAIYCCEYLSDGYTRNFMRNLKRNNRGFKLFYKELLKYKELGWMDRFKACVRIVQCIYFGMVKKA